MDEINKYILNHLLHNGVLKHHQAPELINKIADKLNVQPKNHKQIISEINGNISKHLFRIDSRTCEITGVKVYVIVNKTIDDLSTSVLNVSPVEMEYLELIFQELMLSNTKSISCVLSLNLSNRLKGNISKDHAQLKLNAWFENGYLILADGMVFLGPRSISEFQQYFMGQFAQRMTTCNLCKDFVYFGKICATCNEVLHKHCVEKYWNRNNCCPVCKQDWVEAQERIYNESGSDGDDGDDNCDDSDNTE